MQGIETEVVVVDNNSVDGSNQMLQEKFPHVHLIANRNNVGFSAANNQGIKIAKGKYILILNPDTIVQEDTFRKCMGFMEEHPNAGAMGVKMIDGKGNFLPESKRSLPTPTVSFFKIFGLSVLFPKSKVFGRYHLGYLNNNEVHSIEILPGAFMFVRRDVLEQTGYFDETFFMYGEDIDLSYRITRAGYENYYFPETTIIHYKGESTKKGSINYVVVFYKAMIIFARKHFSKKNARLFTFLINIAIYLRASVSILRRLIVTSAIPVTDAVLIYSGFRILEPAWEKFRYGIENYYPNEFLQYMVPAYVFIWLAFLYLSGAYEKRIRFFDVVRGIALGSLTILLIYALLPENLRFSRALLVLGTIWAFLAALVSRLTLGTIFNITKIQLSARKKRIVIAGSAEECKRVIRLLEQVDISPVVAGLVGYEQDLHNSGYIGKLSQLDEIIEVNKIDEIVFCAKDIPSQDIISTMLKTANTSVEFKIAPPESLSIIGSSSINTAGELYVLHFNSLSMRSARRKKRLFDVLLALLLIILLPLLIFVVRKPWGLVRNIILVLFGFRTWIGFKDAEKSEESLLPLLAPGVLSPVPKTSTNSLTKETIMHYNLLYAKDYRIKNDLAIIFNDFLNLGTK
jgi:GT2 family glycosyltransferase